MSYSQKTLRFECTGCGACCTGGPDYYVAADSREREAIRAFLKISRAWFTRRYLARVDADTIGLRLTSAGHCTFLGADKRCRIYSVRPTQCRTYPWWPELVDSQRHWDEEAKRCEGMNRGAIVPLRVIQRSLARERRSVNAKKSD